MHGVTPVDEPPPADSDGADDPAPETSRFARRHAAAALAVMLLTTGAVAARRLRARLAPAPTAEQCTTLVDRFLELGLRQREPSVRAEEVMAAVERSRLEPEHAADVADCARRLTRAQVECGIAAGYVDELERCVQ